MHFVGIYQNYIITLRTKRCVSNIETSVSRFDDKNFKVIMVMYVGKLQISTIEARYLTAVGSGRNGRKTFSVAAVRKKAIQC